MNGTTGRIRLRNGQKLRVTSEEGMVIEVAAGADHEPYPGFLSARIVQGGAEGSFPYWIVTEDDQDQEDQLASVAYGR